MGKLEKIASKFFIGGGILSLVWVISISLFFPKMHRILSNVRTINGIYFISLLNIVCAIVAILLLKFLKKIYLEKNIKKLNLILLIELFFYFVFLLFLTKYYGISSATDDAGIVLSNANYVLNTGKVSGWYMVSNPQNLFLMYFYLLINKILGSMSYNIIFVVFASLSVATAFLLYKSMILLTKDKKIAFIGMQLYIFCFQISLHVTNVYTDTLSIFLISLGVYCYLRTRKQDRKYMDLVGVLFTSALFAVGFLSKGTTLVLIIAFCLELLIFQNKWNKMKVFIPIFSFLIIQLSWNMFIDSQEIYDTDKVGMPNTHYIFMGLNSGQPDNSTIKERRYILNGTWNQGDLNTSKGLFFEKNLSKDDISHEHFKMIKERLSNFTVVSGFEFLNSKIATSWSSGDLKSTFSISKSGENTEKANELNNSYFVYMLMQTLQFLYYFVALYVFVQTFRNKISIDSITLLTALFTVGMFLFLLLWEASPRYIISLIPFYIILFSRFLKDVKLNELGEKS